MICEFQNKKYRVSLISNFKSYPKMDYQLTCINEDYDSEWDGKIIPHDKFKESWKQGKIKVTI